MLQRGKFYHDDRSVYFFSLGDLTLIDIDPEEIHYKYVTESLWATGMDQGQGTVVHRFVYFDKQRHILYWFNNNQIYRILRRAIELVDNGTDSVLFLKDDKSEPFKILVKEPKSNLLDKYIVGQINFAADILSEDERIKLFILWFYSRLFTLPIKSPFFGGTFDGSRLCIDYFC